MFFCLLYELSKSFLSIRRWSNIDRIVFSVHRDDVLLVVYTDRPQSSFVFLVLTL